MGTFGGGTNCGSTPPASSWWWSTYSRKLYVLYELSSPLCWGPRLIGWGSAAQNLAYLSSLLGLRTMQRCLEDFWVSLVVLASNMTGLVVISLANTTELLFTGERLSQKIKSVKMSSLHQFRVE